MTTFSMTATPKSGPQTSPPGSPRGSVSGAAARVVCAGLTPTTPVTLTLYRSRHRIASTRDYDEETGRMVDVCVVDGIRLYAQRGRWVHSPSEIKELAALERGEGVAW